MYIYQAAHHIGGLYLNYTGDNGVRTTFSAGSSSSWASVSVPSGLGAVSGCFGGSAIAPTLIGDTGGGGGGGVDV